ncbi:MAG: hypothetical protein A2Y40_06585 [Candidatus Margulisbacteria bacterium GWF2_35_9]|nr:MAG: hypothetical protein A2Y40_06585 [Candidatus Margulisbacteria bacterium GWF2_35_9]
MEFVPIIYLNQLSNNNYEKIISTYDSIMLIEGKCNELTDQIVHIEQWLEELPKDLTIFYDLCICSSNVDGHCRIYDTNGYNKEETMKVFSKKLEVLLKKTRIRSLVLSDMNKDTLDYIYKNYGSVIDIWYEFKTKSQLYNVFRSMMQLPFIQKEYHVDGSDLDVLYRITEYTHNIILKPCLTTIDISQSLFQEKGLYTSAFMTSAEAIMIQYLNKEYHIDFLSELTSELCRIGYNKLFIPGELLI